MPTPVDLIGGFYADDSLPWADQDTLNWLPVMAEVGGTRTPSRFATPPGLKPYQNIGTGPIRGMHDLEGGRFIVSGRYLYRISPTGVGVPIGIIPGVGRVSMTHNQFLTGFQLLVENGQGGGGYVYDSNTGSFNRIADEGYPGSISSDYLDSYLLGVEPLGRFWFHSNLADATDYNTLDRYEAEAAPDLIVGLAVNRFEVVVFGQRTIEFFFNAGRTTGTFENRRQTINRGCASRWTIAKLMDTLFWLGNDGIVYRLDGYSAVPVSTGPMARAFADKDWSNAFAFTWEDRGFKVYYLTFPDGHTWGYDVASGLWTRRGSFGMDRWRLTHTVKWGNQWFGGDFQSGRTWELNWDYYLEGDQEFISERTSPCMHDNQNNVGIPFAELIFDTGQDGTTSSIPFPVQPTPPSISGDAPNAIIGVTYSPYSYTVTAGSAAIISVAVVSGSLPAGMTLSNSGVLTAVPLTTPVTSTFTVRATDANGLYAEIQDTIVVRVATVGDVFKVNLYAGSGVQPRALTTLDFSRGGSYLVRQRGEDWARLMSVNSPGPAYMKSFAGFAADNPSVNDITSSGVLINTDVLNTMGVNYFGYSFANFQRFSQTVTWVGNGDATRDIAHNLGVIPGAIFVQPSGASVYIDMYHRSVGANQYIQVNGPASAVTSSTAWGNTAPSTSTFKVGTRYNATSVVYTALVIAHDTESNGFVQCGSYVGNGTAAGPSVNLGWQPQMLILKGLTAGTNQFAVDTSRNPGFTGNDEIAYISVSNNVVTTNNLVDLVTNGFRAGSNFIEVNQDGITYLYIAVRAE